MASWENLRNKHTGVGKDTPKYRILNEWGNPVDNDLWSRERAEELVRWKYDGRKDYSIQEYYDAPLTPDNTGRVQA